MESKAGQLIPESTQKIQKIFRSSLLLVKAISPMLVAAMWRGWAQQIGGIIYGYNPSST
jgi:hypothetical protein